MPEVLVVSDFVNGNRRVEVNWTLESLAKKFEQVTGIPPESQKFQFTSESGSGVETPADQNATLESIGLKDGWKITVLDTRPPGERLDLSESAEDPDAKYEMPLEDYEKRQDTVLQWKKSHKLGRFSDNQEHHEAQDVEEPTGNGYGEVAVKLNSECFVRMVSGKTVRGTVAFIGEVPSIAPGIWVGVRLVSPDGKNNGTVKGSRLFDAEPNHGTLVRPNAVRPLDEDEEEL